MDDSIAQLRADATKLWRLLDLSTEEEAQAKSRSVAVADLPRVVAELKYRLEERLFWLSKGTHAAIHAAGRWGPDA